MTKQSITPEPMFLVDTSIWIELFRANTSLDLERSVNRDDIVTCLPVIQEVLQGFRDETAYRIASEAMFNFPIIENPLNESLFQLAIDLYRSARRQGLTIRSSVDCLIAACALRNNVTVVHRDRDYTLIAQISSLNALRL